MKIILCCSAGMSTSLLVNKMKEAAKAQNLEAHIEAIPYQEVERYLDGTNVILLGPQIRYKLNDMKKIGEKNNIGVAVIDTMKYGRMDGKGVLEDAINLIK